MSGNLPLSRWYFYQSTMNQDLFEQRLRGMVCRSRIPLESYPSDFVLSATGDTYLIRLDSEAWKIDASTWYRSSIKETLAGLLRVEKLEVKKDQPTWLVWSRSSSFWPGRVCEDVRILPSEEDVKLEVAVAWAWIVHVCSKTQTEQRRRGLQREFYEWLRTTPTFTIPGE